MELLPYETEHIFRLTGRAKQARFMSELSKTSVLLNNYLQNGLSDFSTDFFKQLSIIQG